eukprot:1141884-Pelagomonas_calceolata.AAC.4
MKKKKCLVPDSRGRMWNPVQNLYYKSACLGLHAHARFSYKTCASAHAYCARSFAPGGDCAHRPADGSATPDGAALTATRDPMKQR